MAHLYRVILPVTDIERAAVFHAAVFDEAGRRVSPGRHYFECEGTVLACYDPQADGDGYDATPLTEPLYFAVDDLRAVFDRCRAAGAALPEEAPPEVGPLEQIVGRPWGEESFYANDPFDSSSMVLERDPGNVPPLPDALATASEAR